MIDWEQAFDIVVEQLRSCPGPTSAASPAMLGCDLYLPMVVPSVATGRGDHVAFAYGGSDQEKARWYLPFYDAAAELCRIGVLRPGERMPMGASMQQGFHGDGYS